MSGIGIFIFNSNSSSESLKNIEQDSLEKEEKQKLRKENVIINAVDNDYSSKSKTQKETLPDDSYYKALEALKKAEASFLLKDVKLAEELITKLQNKKHQQELTERLNYVRETIEANELVTELEYKVNNSKNIKDLNKARTYYIEKDLKRVVLSLKSSPLKENILNRLNNLQKILSDKESPIITGINNNSFTAQDVSLNIKDDNEYKVVITLNDKDFKYKNTLTKEGKYVVTVIDSAFNESTITFTIDKTSPSFKNITDGMYYQENINVLVDEDNLDKIKATIYADDYNIIEVPNNTQLTKESLYYLEAIDKAGNKTSIQVTIDKTAPKLEKLQIYNLNNINSSYIKEKETLRLLATFSEELQISPIINIAGQKLKLNKISGGNGEVIYTTDITIDDSLKNLKEGNIKYTISDYQDKALNTGDSISEEFANQILIYDKTPPVILKNTSIGSDDIYSYINLKLYDKEGIVELKINDKLYPHRGNYIDIVDGDIYKFKDGKNKIEVTDKAKNKLIYNFIVDKTEPIVEVIYKYGNQTNKNELVTLKFNEEVTFDSMETWLYKGNNTYQKTFPKNVVQTLNFKDKVGNKGKVKINIDWITKNS